MHHRSRVLAPLTALVLTLGVAACGDDDSSADDAFQDSFEDAADEAAADAAQEASESARSEDEGPTEPAPAEDTGTITVAGTTTELTTGDFGICETVNPAFDNAINIITSLADGTYFRVNGTLGDMDPEFDGLFLGDIPEQEQATDLNVTREGRTVSGTANVAAGEVQFSFTC